MLDVLSAQAQSVVVCLVLLGPLAMLVKHERKLKRWLLKGHRRQKKTAVRPALW
jgi:hypothetical protein